MLSTFFCLGRSSKPVSLRSWAAAYWHIVNSFFALPATRLLQYQLMAFELYRFVVVLQTKVNNLTAVFQWAWSVVKVIFWGLCEWFNWCSDAVRRNPLTCRATDSDIAATLKNWLKHAAGRQDVRTEWWRQCLRGCILEVCVLAICYCSLLVKTCKLRTRWSMCQDVISLLFPVM